MTVLFSWFKYGVAYTRHQESSKFRTNTLTRCTMRPKAVFRHVRASSAFGAFDHGLEGSSGKWLQEMFRRMYLLECRSY
jgi:hypothetical protein